MNLESLVLELYADTSRLDREVKSAVARAANQIKKLEQGSLAVKVDEKPLHDLNKLLDVKQAHIRQTAAVFKDSPLELGIDDSQLVSAQENIQSLKSDLGGFSGKPIEVKISQDISASLGKSNDGIVREISRLRRDVRQGTKATKANKEGILGSILTGLSFGFSTNVTGSFSKGFADGIEKETGVSLKDAGEKVGQALAGFSKNVKKYAEGVVSDLAKDVGVEGISTNVGELLSKSLLNAIETATSPTEFLNVFAADFVNGMGEFGDKLLEGGEKLKEINTYLKALGLYYDPKTQSILQAKAVRAVGKRAAPVVESLLGDRAQRLGDIAPDLVTERAKQIIDESVKKKDVSREEIRGMVDSGKDDRLKVKLGDRSVNAPNLVDSETKTLFITIGGYAGHKTAASGYRIAGDIVAESYRQGNENVAALGVRNPDTDIKPELMSGDGKMLGLLGSLVKPNLRGYSKDAVEIAAQAVAAITKNPNIQVKIVGESGGGYAAEEAVKILEIMGYGNNVSGIGIGTPNFIGGLNPQNYTKYLGKNREETLGYESHRVYAPMGFADVSAPGQNLTGLAGHPYENYKGTEEYQRFVFGKITGAKENASSINQSEINKAVEFLSQSLANDSVESLTANIEFIKKQLSSFDIDNSIDLSGLDEFFGFTDDFIQKVLTYDLVDNTAQSKIASALVEGNKEILAQIAIELQKFLIDVANDYNKESTPARKKLLARVKGGITGNLESLGNDFSSLLSIKTSYIKKKASDIINSGASVEQLRGAAKEINPYIREIADDPSIGENERAKYIGILTESKQNIVKAIKSQVEPIATPSIESVSVGQEIPSPWGEVSSPPIRKAQKVSLNPFKKSADIVKESSPFDGARFAPTPQSSVMDFGELVGINKQILTEIKSINSKLKTDNKQSSESTPPVYQGELLDASQPQQGLLQKMLKGGASGAQNIYGTARGIERFAFDTIKVATGGLVNLEAVKKVTQTVAPAFALGALGTDIPLIGEGISAVSSGVVSPLIEGGLSVAGGGIAGLLPDALVSGAGTVGGVLSHVPGFTTLSSGMSAFGSMLIEGAAQGITYLVGGGMVAKTANLALKQATKPLGYLPPAGEGQGAYSLLQGVKDYAGNAINVMSGQKSTSIALPPVREPALIEVLSPVNNTLPQSKMRALPPSYGSRTIDVPVQRITDAVSRGVESDDPKAVDDVLREVERLRKILSDFNKTIDSTMQVGQIKLAQVQIENLEKGRQHIKTVLDGLIAQAQEVGLNTNFGTSSAIGVLNNLKSYLADGSINSPGGSLGGSLKKKSKTVNERLANANFVDFEDVRATLSSKAAELGGDDYLESAQKLVSAIAQLQDIDLNALFTKRGGLNKVGKDLMEGLRKGFIDNEGNLISGISEVAESLPDPIKKILGIASPSKVLAEEVGKPIGQGIEVGAVESIQKAGVSISSEVEKIKATIAKDLEYLEAVTKGDIAKAQSMVQESAGQSGYNEKSSHGLASGRLIGNSFDPKKLGSNTGAKSAEKGFFFASKATARTYAADVPTDFARELAESFVHAVSPLSSIPDNQFDTFSPSRYKKTAISRLLDEFRRSTQEDFPRKIQDELELMLVELDYVDPAFLPKDIESIRKNAESLLERFKTRSKPLTEPAILDVFLKLQKPEIYDQEGAEYRETSYNDILKKAKKRKRDGAIIKNTYDGGPLDDVKVVFKPTQIKLADPITKTDEGSVVPLSARFDDSVADIRGNVGDIFAGLKSVAGEGLAPLVAEIEASFSAIGDNSVESLMSALQGALSNLETSGELIGESLDAGTRKSLEMNSPSKLYIRHGKNTIISFEMGVEGELKRIKETEIPIPELKNQGYIDLAGLAESVGQMKEYKEIYDAVMDSWLTNWDVDNPESTAKVGDVAKPLINQVLAKSQKANPSSYHAAIPTSPNNTQSTTQTIAQTVSNNPPPPIPPNIFGTLRQQFPIIDQAISKVEELKDSIANFGMGALKLVGLALLTKALVDLGAEAVNVYRRFEGIFIASRMVGNGAQYLEKVREQTKALGGDLESTMRSAIQFSTSLVGTNLEATGQQLFLDSDKALKSLGLQTQEYDNAMRAIIQISSKGKVSMEELSGQLGEQVPGALQIAADAMQTNVKGLIQMVSSGNLLAEDFVPKFVQQLKNRTAFLAPAVESSLNTSIGRLGAQKEDLFVNIGAEISPAIIPIVNALSGALKVLTDNFDALVFGVKSLAFYLASPALIGAIKAIPMVATAAFGNLMKVMAGVKISASTMWAAVMGPLKIASVVGLTAGFEALFYVLNGGNKSISDITKEMDQFRRSLSDANDEADRLTGFESIKNFVWTYTLKPFDLSQAKKDLEDALNKGESTLAVTTANINPSGIDEYLQKAGSLQSTIDEMISEKDALLIADPVKNKQAIDAIDQALYGDNGLVTKMQKETGESFVLGGRAGIEEQMRIAKAYIDFLKNDSTMDELDAKYLSRFQAMYDKAKVELTQFDVAQERLSNGLNRQRKAWIELTSSIAGYEDKLSRALLQQERGLYKFFNDYNVGTEVQSVLVAEFDVTRQQSEVEKYQAYMKANREFLENSLTIKDKSFAEQVGGKPILELDAEAIDKIERSLQNASDTTKAAFTDQVMDRLKATVSDSMALEQAYLELEKGKNALRQAKISEQEYIITTSRSILDFNRNLDVQLLGIQNQFRDYNRQLEDASINSAKMVRGLVESYNDLNWELENNILTIQNELADAQDRLALTNLKIQQEQFDPGQDTIGKRAGSIILKLFESINSGESEKRRRLQEANQAQKEYTDTLRRVRDFEEQVLQERINQKRTLEDLTTGFQNLNQAVKDLVLQLNQSREDLIRNTKNQLGRDISGQLSAVPNVAQMGVILPPPSPPVAQAIIPNQGYTFTQSAPAPVSPINQYDITPAPIYTAPTRPNPSEPSHIRYGAAVVPQQRQSSPARDLYELTNKYGGNAQDFAPAYAPQSIPQSTPQPKPQIQSQTRNQPYLVASAGNIPVEKRDYFAKLIVAEAGGESLLGQALVARSVLNRQRVNNPRAYMAKSNDLIDLINAPRQYQPVSTGSINKPRTPQQMARANQAINLAQNDGWIKSELEKLEYTQGQIKQLLNATGFRTPSAFNDPSQNHNRVRFGGHVFNSDRVGKQRLQSSLGNNGEVLLASGLSDMIQPILMAQSSTKHLEGSGNPNPIESLIFDGIFGENFINGLTQISDFFGGLNKKGKTIQEGSGAYPATKTQPYTKPEPAKETPTVIPTKEYPTNIPPATIPNIKDVRVAPPAPIKFTPNPFEFVATKLAPLPQLKDIPDIASPNLSQVLTPIPDFDLSRAKSMNDETLRLKLLFNQVSIAAINADQKLAEMTAISEMISLVQQTGDSIRQMNFNLIGSADTVRRMQSEAKGYLTISEEIQNVGLDTARNYDNEINSRRESAIQLNREVGNSENQLKILKEQLANHKGISKAVRDELIGKIALLETTIKEKTAQAGILDSEAQRLAYLKDQAVSARLVREETQRQYEALKEVSAMQLSLANARYDMGGDLFNVGAIKDARTQAKIAARDMELWAERWASSLDPKVIQDQIAMQKELSDINISKSYLDAIPPLRDFTSGLKDIILMTSSWQEVTKKLIDTLAGLVIDQLVIKPMQNWLAQGIAGVMGWMGDATAPTEVDIPLRKPIEDNERIYISLNEKLLTFIDRIDSLNQKLAYQVNGSTSATSGGFSGILNTGLGLVSSGLGMFGNPGGFTPSNIVGVSDAVKLMPFSLAMGTDDLDSTKVPNFANGLLEGIDKAFAKEKIQSGKQPYLAVLHKGEAVLSTLNGDAQLLRSLKASGQWNHLKANPSMVNYAYGSEFKSRQSSRNSNNTSQTTIYKPEYKIYAQNADSFRKSQSQIEMDSMARMRRARR